MISDDTLKKIERFTVANEQIVAAYVFGSCATGRERRWSDIDIAIMVRGSIDRFERVRLETELSNLLGRGTWTWWFSAPPRRFCSIRY